MRFRSSIALPLVTAMLLVGCGSKQKTSSSSSSSAGGTAAKRPAKANTEKATGELREALLHLRRVHFALDSDKLLPESREALTDASKLLANHPKVQIYIDGHTDSRGTSEYNVALGERRAGAMPSLAM